MVDRHQDRPERSQAIRVIRGQARSLGMVGCKDNRDWSNTLQTVSFKSKCELTELLKIAGLSLMSPDHLSPISRRTGL
jgi:hypothetical protein